MYRQISLDHCDTEDNLKHDVSQAGSARVRSVVLKDFFADSVLLSSFSLHVDESQVKCRGPQNISEAPQQDSVGAFC